jgi:hypothetical protein
MNEKIQKLIMAAQELIDAVEDSIGDKPIEETQKTFRRLGSAVTSLEIAIYDVKIEMEKEKINVDCLS